MAEQKWLLLNQAGAVVGQVITHGPTPTEEGSNPDGHTEKKTTRFGDLGTETYNAGTGRWSRDVDKEQRRAKEARTPSNAELLIMIEALQARLAAVEKLPIAGVK